MDPLKANQSKLITKSINLYIDGSINIIYIRAEYWLMDPLLELNIDYWRFIVILDPLYFHHLIKYELFYLILDPLKADPSINRSIYVYSIVIIGSILPYFIY